MNARTELVRLARTREAIPAREVARKTGMTEAMVSRIENGKTRVTDETIGRYLRAGLITAVEATEALVAPSESEATTDAEVA